MRLPLHIVVARRNVRPFQTSHSGNALCKAASRGMIGNPVSRMSRHYSSDNSSAQSPPPWTQHRLNATRLGKSNDEQLPKSSTQVRRAYIALGSNLGDRVGMIETACKKMSERGIKVRRTSGLWETEPMYVLEQENFINGACEVETSLPPLTLLDELQAIENDMGRKKIIDKGPRNIDLDVLLYEGEVVNHPRLQIPHAGILEREFVLRPLADQPLTLKAPWKLTQDYLNELPPSPSPLSTITPLGPTITSLHALKANRQTQVMAILNITPDSFSDGGVHYHDDLSGIISDFIRNGASIIDVGGQSSAPGTPDVTAEVEIKRVLPVIEQIRSLPAGKDITISIDTYRSSVAEAAVNAGADIINDVSAGQLDPEMLSTMARLGKTVCLMHMRGTPETMTKLTNYEPAGLIPTIAKELLERVSEAEAAGIRRWRIILDPGIGFAKTADQNLEILRRMDELREWPGLQGIPWLLGSSRKGFIGKITGAVKPAERAWGTAATVAAAVQGGADIVRVHDVKEMAQVAKMSDAIWRY
ncbi:Dihydropteroate synthase protein [Rutstroemia sp. NJR-2017a BBW]|nr:Dihydropteroate synthase protein [Rutstroemia sp. NJR-2017a BBW]